MTTTSALRTRKIKVADLDLLPIMNLFSILIPFLLSVVSFQKLALLELELPPANSTADPVPLGAEMQLTAALMGNQLQLWSAHGSLGAIPFREDWVVRCTGSEARVLPANTTAERNSALRCQDGSVARTQQIDEIRLTALDSMGNPRLGWYHTQLGLLTDPVGKVLPVEALPTSNEWVRLDGNTLRWDPRENVVLEKRPLDAFSLIGRQLVLVAERHAESPDAGRISVLAEDGMVTDKVVHLMDAARDNGFHKVSLAKLGG